MMFKNVYTMVFFVRTPRRINFQSEDGCNNSLWKVGNNVPICTVSHSWRLLSKFLWLQKPQIPFNDYNEQVLPPLKTRTEMETIKLGTCSCIFNQMWPNSSGVISWNRKQIENLFFFFRFIEGEGNKRAASCMGLLTSPVRLFSECWRIFVFGGPLSQISTWRPHVLTMFSWLSLDPW